MIALSFHWFSIPIILFYENNHMPLFILESLSLVFPSLVYGTANSNYLFMHNLPGFLFL